MVDLAPGEGTFAAFVRAGVVLRGQCAALRSVEQPMLAALVEDLAAAVEHLRDDPCVARQPAGLTRRDPGPGVQTRRGEPVKEVPVVEVDQQRRSDRSVPGGRQMLDQLGERRPPTSQSSSASDPHRATCRR